MKYYAGGGAEEPYKAGKKSKHGLVARRSVHLLSWGSSNEQFFLASREHHVANGMLLSDGSTTCLAMTRLTIHRTLRACHSNGS